LQHTGELKKRKKIFRGLQAAPKSGIEGGTGFFKNFQPEAPTGPVPGQLTVKSVFKKF